MEIDLIIYVAFIFFILLIFVYVRMLSKDLNDRMDGIVNAIDANFKDLHELKKEILELKKIARNQTKQNDFNDNIMQNCEFLIHSIIDERINELNMDLGLIQENLEEAARSQDSRIASLELANEPLSKLRPDNDSERIQILKLYKEGKSAEEIAIMLNKSPQVINLVLKSL